MPAFGRRGWRNRRSDSISRRAYRRERVSAPAAHRRLQRRQAPPLSWPRARSARPARHTARALAVYVTTVARDAARPRKTRFRLVVHLGRGDSNPLGPIVTFQPCRLHGVLLTQAWPGAPKSTFSRRNRPSGTRARGESRRRRRACATRGAT